jgi:hypothetical protein
MDFGLAKMLSSSQRLTASGAVLGTPTYMAPELWRGDTVDARTDAYSLGVILFEMVVGRPPFESDQPFTLMYKHLNDEPPTPHEWLPDLSETIEGVMLKALAKAPADRFQSAGELARAYRAAVQGQAVDVSPRQALPGVDVRPEAPTQFESELPLPVDISPPPVTSAPTVAPLGDYGAPEGMPVSAGAPDDSGSDSPLPFELPDKMPPAVRDVIEWAAEKGKTVTIPGFVEPSPEVSARKQPGRLPAQVDAGPWRMPDETQAFRQVVGLLNNNEPLIGALYVRGTANWGLWRRLLVAGLIMSIIVGIFGELFSLWLLHVLSTVFWLYVLWQGFRTWRGKIGHYYAGFTPDRVVILPLTPDGIPQPGDAEMAPWTRMQRLRLTDEYLWLEASGAATVTFLGWVPRHGPGGLDNQRKWLLASPIARLVREKGFYVKQ